MKNKLLISLPFIVIAIMAVAFYFSDPLGIFSSGHNKQVENRCAEIMEENPNMSEEAAKALAEKEIAEEEKINERIKNGEFIDGYAGYSDCRKSVKDNGWSSGLIQVGDMVFNQSYCMTVDDVRKVVEESQYADELIITEVFVNFYPAIEVTNSSGENVVTFKWQAMSPEDYPWLTKEENFLSCVKPNKDLSVCPWTDKAVYLPNGLLYFYKNYADEETDTEYFRPIRLKRTDLEKLIASYSFNEGYNCYAEDAGYCKQLGEYSIELGFVDDYSKGRTVTEDDGDVKYYQTIHAYTFEFDTEGNCVSISPSNYDYRFVGHRPEE